MRSVMTWIPEAEPRFVATREPRLVTGFPFRRRLAGGDSLFGLGQLFSRLGKRHAAVTVAANRQRLLAPVDGVVVAREFGPGRGNGHVQPVAVVDLVELVPGA